MNESTMAYSVIGRDDWPTMICDRVHCSITYEAVEGSLTVLAKIHVLMLIPIHIILL